MSKANSALQKWLIGIYCMNYRVELTREHERLAACAATGINDNLKTMLGQRSQNVQTQPVVTGTQLMHAGEKDIKRIWRVHPFYARTYGSFALAATIWGSKMSRT